MNEPLGMPRGTVRAIITILVIVAYLIFVGFSLWAKSFLGEAIEIPMYLTGIIGILIGYYFGARNKDAINNAAETGSATVTPPEPIKYVPPTPAPAENNTDEVKAA